MRPDECEDKFNHDPLRIGLQDNRRRRMSKSIMQSAVENWPEDEAYGIMDLARSGWDQDEIATAADELRARFLTYDDGHELIRRFDAELVRLAGV